MTYAAKLLDMGEAMISKAPEPAVTEPSTASSSHEMPQPSSQALTVPETTSHEAEEFDIPGNLELLNVNS